MPSLDTRQRREVAVGIRLPVADGSYSEGDRRQLLGVYKPDAFTPRDFTFEASLMRSAWSLSAIAERWVPGSIHDRWAAGRLRR